MYRIFRGSAMEKLQLPNVPDLPAYAILPAQFKARIHTMSEEIHLVEQRHGSGWKNGGQPRRRIRYSRSVDHSVNFRAGPDHAVPVEEVVTDERPEVGRDLVPNI